MAKYTQQQVEDLILHMLRNGTLSGAHMPKILLHEADLSEANLIKSNLQYADISGPRARQQWLQN